MEQVTGIKEIAQRCGVSASTVSRVLNGKSCVREETRKRVMDAVKQSNFRPNLLARSLKQGDPKTICMMIPSYGNLIFPRLMRGVNKIAMRNGYTTFLGITDEQQETEESIYNEMRNRQVGGFVIFSARGDESAVYRLREEGVPAVMVNRYRKEDIGRLETISIDNYRAGYVSTQYLIRSGRRRIAIACGDPALFLYTERYRGYCDALWDAGLEVDPALVMQEPAEKRLMLSEKVPDAFLATSDPKAFIIMHALHDLKLRIPRDVAVMGIDNVELSAYMEPPLSTLAQPLTRIGEEAMDMLLRQIEYKKEHGRLPAPENRILDFDLLIRKSTD